MKSRNQKINSVFLVYKRSLYQRFILDEKNAKIHRLLKKGHVSARPIREIHESHQKAVRLIQDYFRQRQIPCRTGSRHLLEMIHGVDLVITLGGDGTFLRTSHHAQNQLIFPVNSDPKNSVGALCSITIGDFKKRMDSILSGKFKTKELSLIDVSVNGKKLPVKAANDVLFTNVSPAATSRYFIIKGSRIEEQKSSGVWISTAAGSTAAISAAGGTAMKSKDLRLQFATREPYQGIFHPYKLTKGFIDPGKTLKLVNNMVHARLYLDGPTTSFDLHIGDEITMALSKKKLRVIV